MAQKHFFKDVSIRGSSVVVLFVKIRFFGTIIWKIFVFKISMCKIFVLKNFVAYDNFSCIQLRTLCAENIFGLNFCSLWQERKILDIIIPEL